MKIPAWIIRQAKKRQRIYIIPTRMGGYLNGLVFLMFLLSVGYNNNLLLIFTLFLFGLNLIWLIQTHFHLHKLRVESVVIEDGHAKEGVHVHINWSRVPALPHDWDISLENDVGESLSVKSIQQNPLQNEGQVIFPTRGVWRFQHLKVKTTKPFGLYQTWVYFRMDTTAYAFPPKVREIPEILKEHSLIEGENQSPFKGPHDVWNLAPYQGEESRKISWKHYARLGELVVKEGEELKKSIVHFRLPKNMKDKEQTLSRIATQMVLCARTEIAFTLETLDGKTDAGTSLRHLNDCLRKLALC